MYKSLFKNISTLTLIQISNTVIPLVIIPFITRIISTNNFGLLEFSRVYCYYFTIMINYGFDLTITREIAINRDNIKKVNNIISQTIYAKTILFIISTIIFITTTLTISSLNEISSLLILTYLINIGYTFFPIWYFQGTENLTKIAVINLIIKIIIAIITFVLINSDGKYWIYNFLQSISLILTAIVSFFILYRYNSFKRSKIQIKEVREIFIDGFPIFIGTLLVAAITSLFFLFLKTNSSEIELAKFSTSNKLISTIQIVILLPFSQAFFPMMAKEAKENISKFKNLINKAAIILLIVNGIIGFFILFYGELIVTIVFGKKYLTCMESLRILAFLPLLASLTNIYAYQGLLCINKDKMFLNIHIIFALLTIILNIIFINNYNTTIASYIRVIIEILLFLTSLILYYTNIKKIKNEP